MSWHGWKEYMLVEADDREVDNYIQLLEDGEEYGFFDESPNFALALGCYHTYAAAKLGVSRQVFAAMVSLARFTNCGCFDVPKGIIYATVDEDNGVVQLIGPVITSASVSSDSRVSAVAPSFEWREPWPGANDDLPRDALRTVMNTGSFHTAIVQVLTVVKIEYLPALLELAWFSDDQD